MTPTLAPFIRRGQPIPLTPGDYAARALDRSTRSVEHYMALARQRGMLA